jgi:hypothetical protein
MSSNAGLTALLIIGGSVGVYVAYRYLKGDVHHGGHAHQAARGYFTGAGTAKAVDPRNCLCPMDLDPLNATLPSYTCPCNVPGAVRPPYAGYTAVGRGGGGGRGFHQQMQQQDQDQGGGGGDPQDPYAQPPPPPPYHHPHRGFRRR